VVDGGDQWRDLWIPVSQIRGSGKEEINCFSDLELDKPSEMLAEDIAGILFLKGTGKASILF